MQNNRYMEMKRIIHSNILIATLCLMLGLGVTSCQDSYRTSREDVPNPIEAVDDVEEGWFATQFTIDSEGLSIPDLRALTEEGENDITQSKVRMLVFDQNGQFHYEAKVIKVEPSTNPADKKNKGKITLLAQNSHMGGSSTFVLLANVDPTGVATPAVGTNMEDVMKLFTFDINNSGAWSNGSLPMWGTSASKMVNHSNGAMPNLGTIHLIRAVARVDVGLNMSAAGTSQFNELANGITYDNDGSIVTVKLTDVFVYNTNNKGRVAPKANDATVWDESNRIAKAPSIPEIAPTTIAKINYSTKVAGEKLLLREIYLPEAVNTPIKATQAANGETLPAADQANYLKRPYIVVGLVGADRQNPTKKTYFRIDYLKRIGNEETATYEYLQLLRNHRYMVNITNVDGPGFDTEEEAQKGPAANIMYNVVVWEESQMSNVQYDGQYMLGVSQDHFTFYREGGSLTAKVQTSWPDGFEVKNLPDWITYTVEPADPSATGNTDEKIVTFKVTEHVTADRIYPLDPNDALNPLKAAYVEAGRMKWFLNFKQSQNLKVTLEIFADPACTEHLEFININQFGEAYGAPDKVLVQDGQTLSEEEAGAIVTFYVKTEPSDIEPVITTDGINRFNFQMVQNMGSGVWKYTVTAPDITENIEPFDHYITDYRFKITHAGTNKSASDKLIMQQVEYNAIPFYDDVLKLSLLDPKQDFFYIMDGKKKQYYVKANVDYDIEMISAPANNNAGNVIPSFPKVMEKNPALSGRTVPFTPAEDLQDPKLFEGKATFRISSPLGLFPPQEFSIILVSAIIQPEANTYMVKAGAKQGILIPVSRVNTAADYYDRLLNKDALIPSGSKSPFPLPGGSPEFYRLNRLDNDDRWTVNIVWTDIHDTTKSKEIEVAGLRKLEEVYGRDANNSYIFVQVGNRVGNISVQIRSGKLASRNPLWSWHIWIVQDYPEVKIIKKSDVGGSGAAEVKLMSHLLGAQRAPRSADNYNENNSEVFGMQYQWGRKDPFPSFDVYRVSKYYDAEGRPFSIVLQAKGDRDNKGEYDPFTASGGTYTMKASIENPASIVVHQSFWNIEMMPFAQVNDFYDKAVFRYPWNRMPNTGALEDNDHIDPHVGKTVFDPSPYGFRIMNQDESITLRYAYYKGPNNTTSGLSTPLPGTLYDGEYANDFSGNDECIFGVAQARKDHAGCYLLNSTGGWGGWTASSNTNATYKRALTVSIRPVLDPEMYGDQNNKAYTEYLPE